MEDQLTVKRMDYRDIPQYGKRFDRVISVGMVEHVGRGNYQLFIDCVKKVMEPKVNEKTKLLEARLQVLSANERDNQGVCRRIQREIRKLKKEQNL